MLPKKNRITRIEFDGLLKHGRNIPGVFLQAKYMFLTSKDSPRDLGPLRGVLASQVKESQFSFVIPKSVSKFAVKRNILRRRGYGAVSKILSEIEKPIICAFFFKKGSAKVGFVEIEEEIQGILRKIV